MRILHYTLGLPPVRSGGLTVYSCSLMEEQIALGNSVFLLYPQQSLFRWTRSRIVYTGLFQRSIPVYKCYSGSIVPLLEGVKKNKDVICYKPLSDEQLKSFYNLILPDVFHIHTLMGLPIELLIHFKRKGVKLLFTTHDFYGICPKVNLINFDGDICNINNRNCKYCNRNSPNRFFLYFRNHPILLRSKKAFKLLVSPLLLKRGGKAVRDNDNLFSIEDNLDLFLYYERYFELIDIFHFNSRQTEGIYKKVIGNVMGKVISISHSGIIDKRRSLLRSSNVIEFVFIGNDLPYKGLPLLMRVLNRLDANNWALSVFGATSNDNSISGKITYFGTFTHKELSKVFSNKHLLIVPSICNETFGFVVLEAISRGVPVMVSNTVGAKDIINRINPYFIFDSEKELLKKLNEIVANPNKLSEYNELILNLPFEFSMRSHTEEINRLYIDRLAQ